MALIMTTNQCSSCVPARKLQSNVKHHKSPVENDIDYSQRGQWLRAAVLGANDGLVSVACLMISVGAMRQDVKAMILSGFASLVAGACNIAIEEYVSVYSQLDVELALMKRENKLLESIGEQEKKQLPNPMRAAVASSLAFSAGAIVPLLVASFIRDSTMRLGVVIAAVSVVLVVFGWIWSILGGTRVMKSCFRVLFGGLMVMAITFGRNALVSYITD